MLRNLATLLIVATLAACQSYIDGSTRTPGEFADDVGIQTNVKTLLVNDKAIKGININVDVSKGVVSLYGRIPSEELRTKAVDIAGRVKGVREVNDRLTVVPE